MLKMLVKTELISRKAAVPVPGPTGGGSLSDWKEADAKEGSKDGKWSVVRMSRSVCPSFWYEINTRSDICDLCLISCKIFRASLVQGHFLSITFFVKSLNNQKVGPLPLVAAIVEDNIKRCLWTSQLPRLCGSGNLTTWGLSRRMCQGNPDV